MSSTDDRWVASAAVPPVVAIATALWARSGLPPAAAYFTVWGAYLLTLAGLCVFVVGPAQLLRALGPARARAAWGVVAVGVALGPMLVVATVAGPEISLAQWAAVTALALVNAPLEELYWRGGFAVRFPDVWRAVVWPTMAFTSWHVGLALVPGVAIEGGAWTLIGGAAGLGLVWALVSWATGTVRWALVGHVLTNVAAFTGLFHDNGFGA